jgi:Protein of unknown function (DUF2892)
MLRNLGSTDRLIRILFGEGLIITACFAGDLWRWIAAPGLLLMITAALATCPTYLLLHIRTNLHS